MANRHDEEYYSEIEKNLMNSFDSVPSAEQLMMKNDAEIIHMLRRQEELAARRAQMKQMAARPMMKPPEDKSFLETFFEVGGGPVPSVGDLPSPAEYPWAEPLKSLKPKKKGLFDFLKSDIDIEKTPGGVLDYYQQTGILPGKGATSTGAPTIIQEAREVAAELLRVNLDTLVRESAIMSKIEEEIQSFNNGPYSEINPGYKLSACVTLYSLDESEYSLDFSIVKTGGLRESKVYHEIQSYSFAKMSVAQLREDVAKLLVFSLTGLLSYSLYRLSAEDETL